MAAGPVVVALGLGLGPHAAAPTRAQFEDYAAAVTAMSSPRWVGQRVAAPPVDERPEAPRTLEAADGTRLHGPADAALEATLSDLHEAAAALDALGLPRPPPDGRLGGGPGLDVYLDPTLDRAYRVGWDGRVPLVHFDAAQVHLRLAPSLSPAHRRDCLLEGMAAARLAALDPAEAEVVRAGAARALLGATTSSCLDEPEPPSHDAVDAHPGPIADLLEGFARAGGSRAVYDAMTLARQRTWEGEGLRGSPDLFDVLTHARGLPFTQRLVLRAIDAAPRVRPSFHLEGRSLPARTAPHDPPVGLGGFVVTALDGLTPDPGGRIRVFLRGEAGTRWGLAAVRLDAAGAPTGVVEAPSVPRAPNAYLVVERGDEASLRIVVVHLGLAAPDADAPDTLRRTFHLVVDRGADAP